MIHLWNFRLILLAQFLNATYPFGSYVLLVVHKNPPWLSPIGPKPYHAFSFHIHGLTLKIEGRHHLQPPTTFSL